ncbi:ATP synthase F1 subunit gamma [bacterium]|nr:ATP synthase F1 subunit gamma [bacterium]
MPNLKDIKNRIQSVQSTKKITRAMKMVAGAKVRHAEVSVKASRPYASEMMAMFKNLLNSTDTYSSETLKIKAAIDNYPKLLERREVRSVGLLVIGSNKGLAGAYNSNVAKYALQKAKEYKEQDIDVKFFIAGQEPLSILKRRVAALGASIEKKYFSAVDDPSASDAVYIAEDLAEYFVDGRIDKIEVITTRFRNMVSYRVEEWHILPVDGVLDAKEKISDGVAGALMEFLPDKHQILQKIVPMYMTNTIYQSLAEAHASELASRMTAMSAATNNAEKIIHDLSIQYNKIRQSAITNEIIEVVSGANSL